MNMNQPEILPQPNRTPQNPDPQYIDIVVKKVLDGILAGLEVPRKAYEAGQIVGFIEGAGLTLLVVLVCAFLFRKKTP